MNVVWPVNALYLGPLGIWAYLRMGKKQADKPFWQEAATADTHCAAGCTIGDAIAESVVFFAGWKIAGDPVWAAILCDFAAAYLVGIVFQYLTRDESGWEGLKGALKADTASLLAFEIGMFAWMLLSRFVLFADHPLHANQAAYWFMMQLAMWIGFATAYPVNRWLLRAGLKEAM